jgi:hypothetical protein
MVLKHGIPQRNAPYTSREDVLRLEDWKRKFQQEKSDVITFGEYFRADSRKDTHFTDQIPQYDAAEENLNLTDNRILIQNMTLMSKQQLSFRVWLFGTNKFYADNPDNTKVVDFIDFDLVTYGKPYKNTGLYILTITDLNLLYNDLDQTNKLHVSIENLSEAPKLAVTSELIFQAVYESLETKSYHTV